MATKSTTKKPKAKASGDDLLAQYWQNPDDLAPLRVWADTLSEAGDPRGEFVQLSLLDKPTPEQLARKAALDKKERGKLVGPAREYLREFELGANGLVARARCEADKLVAGLAEIEQLNPRLSLKVTSLKNKAIVEALGKVSLERIYHVGFTFGVLGSQGGTQMTDAYLTKLAPAFRRVRHLALCCSGSRDKCFTPVGLEALGNTAEALEYLAINYYSTGDLPPIDDYARVIASAPGFKNLKVVFLRGATRGLFDTLPKLVYAETGEKRATGTWWSKTHPYGMPADADELEPVKRGEITKA